MPFVLDAVAHRERIGPRHRLVETERTAVILEQRLDVGLLLTERFSVEAAAAATVQSLAYYLLLAILTLSALRLLNVPLTAFTVAGGALAIGVGFGSQNIVNNFISGLILQVERPIKVGDMIEIDANYGEIERIGPRSTRVRTFDNIHLIVPKITKSERVLAFFDDTQRLFYVIPMGRRSVIGTTDTRVDEPHTEVNDEDREFLLGQINARLDLDKPLTTDDIIADRSGVRPLVVKTDGSDKRDVDWTKLSRKHEIEVDYGRKVISIFGGKLTDCLNQVVFQTPSVLPFNFFPGFFVLEAHQEPGAKNGFGAQDMLEFFNRELSRIEILWIGPELQGGARVSLPNLTYHFKFRR